MSLTREWERRVHVWIDELPRHFYEELGEVELEGYVTRSRLRPDEAARGPFMPMPVGAEWGAKWEYGWFRGRVVLPAAAEGRRVVLRFEAGGDGIVFSGGVALGARDREHPELPLSRSGRAGTCYELLAECYAGHGPIEENVGPVPPGRVPIPEPGPRQRRVGRSSFGTWNEDAYQLWLDAETLHRSRASLPWSSLRFAEIDEGLRGLCRIVDFELPREGRDSSFRAAREYLAPLLSRRNGDSAPTYRLFGQSHLDLAWQWPREETLRKAARTVSTQLALMDEYPEYRFLWCQAPLFLMLKEGYPEIWGRLRDALRDGSLIAEGATWLEPDTNIPSGESLARQFLYARRFFDEELGAAGRGEATAMPSVLWLPDTFGFSAALPQVMRSCGVGYFATKKLLDGYGDGEPFPYGLFEWQGIDGTRVLADVYRKGNAPLDPAALAARREDEARRGSAPIAMHPFGHGDGGGGPTRDMLEYARRLADFEGLPKTAWGGPREFFEEVERRGLARDVYVGELYFSEHRGTYSSQARIKRAARKTEFALRDAEIWGAAASALAGFDYPAAGMEAAWKALLMNHFHDVIAGVGIRRVNEEAEEELAAAMSAAERVRDDALRAIVESRAPGAGAALVFNSLSWPRRELVALPGGASACADGEGRALPAQQVGGATLVEVELPPCGWTVLRPGAPASLPLDAGRPRGEVRAGDRFLENEFLRVEFDGRGAIVAIRDKESRREIAAGACNEFRLYRDVNGCYDAWDIGSMYEENRVGIEEAAELRLLDTGPLVARIGIERRIGSSRLSQIVSLRRGSRRLDFETRIDWREDHKLLKVAFEVDIHADEALSEIQFGYVRRPTHRSHRRDADRFETCHHKYVALVEPRRGFAVLNDCKYGSSASGRTLALTLLKSAFVPDMEADRGLHEFTYSIYPWNGPFAESGLARAGYELNSPPLLVESAGAAPAGAPAAAPAHSPGGAGPSFSAFSIDDPAVILEAAKPAEDGSGDIVLRLYECLGSAARCALSIGVGTVAASEADMLERPGARLEPRGGLLELDFRPFEIKTLRLSTR